jgi:hypothetical protein
MNKIYIKGFFGDWKEVSKEKAKEYIENIKTMNATSQKEQNKIRQKHLKGIKVEEL